MKLDPFVAIHLKGVSLQVIVGTLPHERAVPQEITADISFTYDASQPAVTDALADAVDYAAMHERIIKAVATTRFQLLERLGAFILEVILHEQRIVAVTILLEKARIIPGVLAVGVQLSASRPSQAPPILGRCS